MNNITIELQKVRFPSGEEKTNLLIRGTGQAGLITWPYSDGGHYLETAFYTIDPKQVLEQMLNLLREQVAV